MVGTDYRTNPENLQSLKHDINAETQPPTTFRNIHDLNHRNRRVVMMEIPAAPAGMPVAWKGHYYGRAGNSLTSLAIDKLDEIRNQTISTDWSAQIVGDASLDDLDEEACERARHAFAQKKHARVSARNVAEWPLATLLERAKVTRSGKITRTALLLLGKPEASHHLSPHLAQMTWKLEGQERAYEHFGLPFLISTTELYRRIRNVNVRFLPRNRLVAHEAPKYDQAVVLEALHNCIAHQDYGRNARIVVTEHPAKLTFENEGAFFEGTWEDYIDGTRTPHQYRNPFLVQAMTELNMIDTMGYGIHSMFNVQRDRYFPLPDYEFSSTGVRLTIHGNVIDMAYTHRLMENSDLPLPDVLALDRIQKGLPVPEGTVAELKRAGLIEGDGDNLHVSASVMDAVSKRVKGIQARLPDNRHYQRLIITHLSEAGGASRKEIDDLLWNRLGDTLSDDRKRKKISYLINRLRKSGHIANMGTRARPDWRLTLSKQKDE